MTSKTQQKAHWLNRLAWGAIILLVLAAGIYYQYTQQQLNHLMVTRCDPVLGCTFSDASGNAIATLKFAQKPSPVQAFGVNVTAKAGEQVTLRFDMKGMAMGPAAYKLQSASGGVFTGKVILPVCIQGRADWRATLTLDQQSWVFFFTTHS
ncbi:hypothetical protein [Leeia oryzae]|uniref:hypothetical protein n=1 Tax=Leeia oryzae TaxID=356662 RepID=UPI00037D4ACB|nr:hypothetical protein [Leeia oryzae]